jgi:arginyl-tRNA synthetase
MENICDLLRTKASAAVLAALGSELPNEYREAEVVQSTSEQFGHYQCNSALKIAKALKTNPRQIAEKIVSNFDRTTPSGKVLIQKIEVAGAGFINITLDPSFVSHEIDQILKDPRLGVSMPHHKQKIIVEFSSPNIAKELHVGHLRSTIIGDALARLFEFLGHHVLRLNHVGDWGTQFGMLIAYMQENAPKVLSGEESADLQTLMQWYRASKRKFDEDAEFKKRAQLEVIQLQGGNPKSLHAWKIICEISRKSYQEIYDILDVKLTERGESFYNPYLAPLVDDLTKKGLVTISDGAKCIFLDGFISRDGTPLPMIVQKSDGGYNYDTTDMAAMRYRIEVDQAERIIIVTDAGQSLHFQMIIKASELAGYLDPNKERVDHVPFGVVLGPDGKKYKTRSGETEKLMDLLLEAVSEAKKIMKERLPEANEEEIESLSEILGIDAIKYADLSGNRIKDYVFSYERMLKFEGNTAAFLLYAYVRIQGIKRKVQKEISSIKSHVHLQHPSEIALGVHIRQLGEILDSVSKDLLPSRLCDYLYTLAEKFHAFFRDCRVEGTPEEESRLLLCEATGRVLEKGLFILGLKTMDRM